MAFSRQVRAQAPSAPAAVPDEDIAHYKVIFAPYVNIRATPRLDAPVMAIREHGKVVTLRGWDGTRLWRQHLSDAVDGWMMVTHPTLGPLLEEVDCQEPAFPGETELGVAVRVGRIGEVQRLLAARADPNEPDNLGETPLFDAAAKGNSTLVAMLLDARAEPGHQSVTGLSPLDFAKGPEAAAILAALNPAKVSSADQVVADRALRRLRRASLAGRCLDRKEEIARNGADTNYVTDDASQNVDSDAAALAAAVAEGRVIEARRLLKSGADPNVDDDAGETPLFNAARLGDSTLVAELLDARADPNHKSLAGKTASAFATGVDTSAILAGMNPEKTAGTSQRVVGRALHRLRRASLLGRCLDRVQEVAHRAEEESSDDRGTDDDDSDSGLSDSDSSEAGSPSPAPLPGQCVGNKHDPVVPSLLMSPERMAEIDNLDGWYRDEAGTPIIGSCHNLLTSTPSPVQGAESWEYPLTNAQKRMRAASLGEKARLFQTEEEESGVGADTTEAQGHHSFPMTARADTTEAQGHHSFPMTARADTTEAQGHHSFPMTARADTTEAQGHHSFPMTARAEQPPDEQPCPSKVSEEAARPSSVSEGTDACGEDTVVGEAVEKAETDCCTEEYLGEVELSLDQRQADEALGDAELESGCLVTNATGDAESAAPSVQYELQQFAAAEKVENQASKWEAADLGCNLDMDESQLTGGCQPGKWDDADLGCDLEMDETRCFSERSLPTMSKSKPNRQSLSKRPVA